MDGSDYWRELVEVTGGYAMPRDVYRMEVEEALMRLIPSISKRICEDLFLSYDECPLPKVEEAVKKELVYCGVLHE